MATRPTMSIFILLALSIGLAGCAAGIQVSPVGTRSYEATKKVAVLTAKPDRAFVVIARFSGHLSRMCPARDRYCDVRKRAMALGGDAIWIQRTDVTEYPGEWIMVKGQLTHLYASQDTKVEGVVVRYKRPGMAGSPDGGSQQK